MINGSLKILITGGSGLLALNWAYVMRETNDVTLVLHKKNVVLNGVASVFVNLESEREIFATLVKYSPDVVVHAAGLTNVDDCERNPILAEHVNAELAANVASACKKAGVKMVYISTDHLFSGEMPLLTEEAITSPINAYAASKLNGERAVKSIDSSALIIRTNFFGWGHELRQSFSDWIFDNVNRGKEVTLFDDVYFTPILIDSLANSVHGLLAIGASGIFNVVSDKRISKYAFGLLLCEKFGLSSHLIKRDSISSIKMAAPRPNDMSLSNSKLKLTLGIQELSVSNQLDQLKIQLEKGRHDEIKKAIREK